MGFSYSENIPLFNKSAQIINAPVDVQEYFNKIYENRLHGNNLIGIDEGLLLNIINSLNKRCSEYTLNLDVYQKCCDLIDRNIAAHITAEDVAKAMHYSVTHLNRVVKMQCGKCLSTIIAERKVNEIKKLAKDLDYSTTDIACQLNFETPELLRKYFKYHTGISLKEYKALTY